MNQYQKMYQKKLQTPQEIAARIQSGYVCGAPTGLGQPVALVEAIADHILKNDLHGVLHHQTVGIYPSPFYTPELKGKYSAVSWFTMGAGRAAMQSGLGDIMPAFYGEFPALWREYLSLDVFYAMVAPMERNGFFTVGATGAETMAQLERARFCFLEVNPNLPRITSSEMIHISQVDALCESNLPISEGKDPVIDEISRTIGNIIAEQIPDGATLQLGIGAIPDSVGLALKDKHDLGIHTEMFTESMIDLIECGAVTNMQKKINKGKSVATFAYGSRRVYDFIDQNPGVEFHAVDYTNDPRVIAQNDKVVSINSCIEVDLFGQVCAESIGTKHYSGTGGQMDFVRGAKMSKGGRCFIAFQAAGKHGDITKIVPTLSPGAIVTTNKNDVDCIVTEYGIASLRGKTLGQRAKALIAIAHPNFRDQLLFEARKMNLMV